MVKARWPVAAGLLTVSVIGCGSPAPPPEATTVREAQPAQRRTPQLREREQSALQALRQEYPAATVQIDDQRQLVQAIDLGPPAARPAASDARTIAADFLTRRAVQLFSIQEPRDLEIVSEERDPQIENQSLIRVQQKIRGVPVFGGELVISVKTGEQAAVASVTSTLAPAENVDTTPRLTEGDAIATASQAHSITWQQLAPADRIGEPDNPRPTAQLFVFDPPKVGREGAPALSWAVTIGTFKYFVDAHVGGILHSYRVLPHALNRRTFECDKKPCALVLTEKQILVPRVSADATRLHQLAKEVYDYFDKTFGRRGFDDRGTGGSAATQVDSLVLGLKNAKYHPLAQTFLFERGWVARDLFAHEFTHAILLDRPILEYTSDAGAVSEFLADFFAVMVDRAGPANPWKIGEDVPGGILRDLMVPHGRGFDRSKDFDSVHNDGQAALMSEYVRPTDPICASLPLADNGCVHFNAGILSSAAVIAVEGGSAQKITALGAAKMQQIVYWSMLGLSPLATLGQAAAAQTRKCLEFASNSKFALTRADCSELAKSHVAVGL